MKKFALIVAGGAGSRIGTDLPKQFLEIAGKPLLMHTISIFSRFDQNTEIILVLPENHHKLWSELCLKYSFSIPHRVVSGGETRFNSVKNGLDSIEDDGIVFIHDGVRPLVSHQTLTNCLETAIASGNATPVIPVSESVRFTGEEGSHSVDRSHLVLIQTPQTFRVSLIKKAYQQPFSPKFTDDATLLEITGETICLVQGNRHNIKITWPEDLKIAEALLSVSLTL